MRKLLKAETPFVWTEDCQKELDFIKETLLSDPILKPLDPNKDLVIMCDAAYTGFGYVILQEGDDKRLHAVFNGGNALMPSQKNYCATDLELTSLVLALRSIDWYVQHRHITVFTDNARVLYYHKWNPLSPRQKRMVAYLQQFQLDLRYLKGVRNMSADCLSRCYEEMSHEERVELQQKSDKKEFVVSINENCEAKRERCERDFALYNASESEQNFVLENATGKRRGEANLV